MCKWARRRARNVEQGGLYPVDLEGPISAGADWKYNDLAPREYEHILAGMDRQTRAVFHSVRDEAGLVAALEASNGEDKLHLIQMILGRMAAPDSLV